MSDGAIASSLEAIGGQELYNKSHDWSLQQDKEVFRCPPDFQQISSVNISNPQSKIYSIYLKSIIIMELLDGALAAFKSVKVIFENSCRQDAESRGKNGRSCT